MSILVQSFNSELLSYLLEVFIKIVLPNVSNSLTIFVNHFINRFFKIKVSKELIQIEVILLFTIKHMSCILSRESFIHKIPNIRLERLFICIKTLTVSILFFKLLKYIIHCKFFLRNTDSVKKFIPIHHLKTHMIF